MNDFALRITDHRTGFDQTIEVTRTPTILGELSKFEFTLQESRPANFAGVDGDRYTINADGTVIDNTTGLMWSQANVGDDSMNWNAADQACRDLRLGGHSDWRLPTLTELESLRDITRHKPCIDTTAFPDCKSAWYWTNSPCAWDSSCAWFVSFGYGGADSALRDGYGAFARAVRSVPAGQ